jgi:branched-chain amino acid transport system substrate-binding protein
MKNNKMIAMMLTMSMLAAAFAGCLGGDNEEPEDDWSITMASDVSADFVESGWDPIIPNLNAGEMCDAIISAMTKTDERDQVVDFTRAYYTSSQGVIGADGSAAISDVSDLNAAGTTIAVQSGTTSDLYANENLGMATISAFDDFPSVIAAINNGDAHYAMGDAPVLSLEGDLMVTFSDENFGLATRETSGELLGAMNVAIGAMVASGEYDAIYGAWFDGAVTLADDTTADTATAYPAPSEGSDLTAVLESGSLRLCTDPFYPPFESYADDGSVVGFDADFAHAMVDEIAAHYMGAENPMFQAPVVDDPAVTIKLGFLNDASGPISQFAAPFTFAWGAAMDDLNAMGDDYVFEVIEADSGCDGTMAQSAAQSLVDSGVVAVAGAACSGASMGANAILSAAGIPMVSYASTSPALSDATAYPHFYRIVPSDALQGQAAADMIAASGVSNTAVVHMTNSYGSGLADAVAANLGSDNVCLQSGYEETTTDFAAAVQAVMDAGCDSVFLGSYSADGAMIVETMAVMGATIPIFSADGMAGEAALNDYTNPAAANGIQVTRPRAAAAGAGVFAAACAADDVCSTGIFTSEAYDAVMMIGHAAMHEDGANMGMHVPMVGDEYAGDSGTHTFLDNGDVGGSGYDVCTFHHVPTYGEYFNCDRMWEAGGDGVTDVEWMGATVKIGFLNDATGPIAVYAAGFVAASQIGVSLANTIGYSNGVQFEIVYADSGCDGAMGQSAAQSLVDAGVWGAVGAACSGASMGANAVLSAAGIPQVSYASTSPALSDASAYPGFFRVVPSDAFQGSVIADVMTTDGHDNVAVLHMTNAYGAGLADAFVANMAADSVCTQIGYDEATTDHSGNVQAIIDAGCTSVMMVSYASDGAAIIEELAAQGYSGSIYGADGVAEEGLAADMSDKSLVDGIIATKPAAAGGMSTVGYVFAGLCAQSPDCAGGIYTAEAFDAVTIVAFAAFTALATPGLDANMAVMGTGQGWEGASGAISFMDNGDVPAAGFCIGEFSHDATTDTVSYDCARNWDPVNGIA